MNKWKNKKLTADDVWAMFAETDKKIAENAKARAETEKLIKEVGEEIKEVSKQIGGISNNSGYHAEQFFQDSLTKTLTFGGEKYDYIMPNLSKSDKTGGVEFDIVLVNGKSIAVIEVKNRIHPDFITELTEEKLGKFRKYFPEYKNHKVYLGIAGFSFDKKVLNNAKKHGIGIIRQVGESIEIEADKLKAY